MSRKKVERERERGWLAYEGGKVKRKVDRETLMGVYVRANDDATVRVTRLKPLTPIDRTI